MCVGGRDKQAEGRVYYRRVKRKMKDVRCVLEELLRFVLQAERRGWEEEACCPGN